VPLSCGDVGRQPQIGRTARPRCAADWAAWPVVPPCWRALRR